LGIKICYSNRTVSGCEHYRNYTSCSKDQEVITSHVLIPLFSEGEATGAAAVEKVVAEAVADRRELPLVAASEQHRQLQRLPSDPPL
jgi:hypothetical protein